MKSSAPLILIVLSLLGCANENKSPAPQVPAAPTAEASDAVLPEYTPSASIARPWLATGISCNGSLDPNFPKDAGIRMHLKDNGTYTMTGPGAQTQGAWKMETASELHLMDSSAGGVQRFAVDTLTNERLALRLMDEQNAVVVLLYKAE